MYLSASFCFAVNNDNHYHNPFRQKYSYSKSNQPIHRVAALRAATL
ncbi:hypothetical protein APA_2998 [Pseudanabaena sp. lw0831]|nr:hypothetical protein APA_2998 [Pseudanabaena sp. lw0831]